MAGPTWRWSRDLFCLGVIDAAGNLFLTERVPFRYVELPDTVAHPVVAGDTWWGLAARYYPNLGDWGAWLWAVVADFQPTPVVDPTVALVPGSTVYVPSWQTVAQYVFAESRRLDFQAGP